MPRKSNDWPDGSRNWIWTAAALWASTSLCLCLNCSRIHWCNASLTFSIPTETAKWISKVRFLLQFSWLEHFPLQNSFKESRSSAWKATKKRNLDVREFLIIITYVIFITYLYHSPNHSSYLYHFTSLLSPSSEAKEQRDRKSQIPWPFLKWGS